MIEKCKDLYFVCCVVCTGVFFCVSSNNAGSKEELVNSLPVGRMSQSKL